MQWNLQSNAGDVLSLGPRTAGQLAVVGIRTVAELVAASPHAISRRLNEKAISAEIVSEWQRESQLIVALPQLPAKAARLLAAAGFASAKKVGYSTPTELLAAFETAGQNNSASWLAETTLPTIAEISLWIRLAGQIQKSYAA